MKFQKVKGMEDLYPEDYAIWLAIAEKLRVVARRFGFQEVDMPAVETMKTLAAKSGEEIKEQIFVFEKKGGEELGLRFDLTVPITRMFVAKQFDLPKPVKWFAVQKMWRYEAPQKGRLREFSQLSAELFGSNKPEADAECINLMIALFEALGLTSKDFFIKINNRKLLEGLLLDFLPKSKLEAVERVIDKWTKISEEEFDTELNKLKIDATKRAQIKHVVEFNGDPEKVLSELPKHFTLKGMAAEGAKELQALVKFVPKNYLKLDLSVARGLAYYTGNVYECFDKEEKFRALAGGGRYNDLVGLFGGSPAPATGFAIGFATLQLLLKEKKLLPKPDISPDYYIAPVNEDMIPKAVEIASKLRKKAVVDIDLQRRKLSKQFEFADSIGAKKVVIVGPKDIKEDKVTVRDMKTGKESKIKINAL